METRESKLKDFTRSREYLSLEREIIDSVQQVMSREVGNEEDMELMVKLFDKLLAEYQVDPITREKMFWEVIGTALKDNVFEEISRAVEKPIEDSKYDEAEQIINVRIVAAIKKLSSTIFRNLSKRDFARMILKSKFYSYVPDLAALLKEAGKDKKAKMKVPAGRTEQQTWEIGAGPMNWPELGQKLKDNRPSLEFQKLTNALERTWAIPNLEEIAPGLIIEIKNRFGEITVFEILSKPYSKPNDEDRRKVFVKARIDGTTHEEEQNLVNWGIMPMGENFGSIAGNWKDGFIPSGTWYRKRKKQGSQ